MFQRIKSPRNLKLSLNKKNTGSNNNRHVKKVRKKVQHREENLSAVNAQKRHQMKMINKGIN